MYHACACWRGLNTRQLTTQTPLCLPADAGGRAARLLLVWTRMAAKQGQKADHTKPPFFFLADAGGRAARLFIGWK